MSDDRTFVIIGASQAGGWVANTLRNEGFEGKVILLGEEPYLPYERPPLSKAALLGEVTVDSTYFWQQEALDEANIEVRLNTKATAIDREAKEVVIEGDDRIAYDKLAITTGARVRELPIDGAQLPGVFYLRTMEDTLAIREAVKEGSTAMIVGGGWIGLECAATLTKLGCKSVVVEALDRLCARAITPEISDWLLQFHLGNGVDIRLNTGVEKFEGDGKLERAVLAGGENIDCSIAVVGIGVIPNAEIAAEAGLDTDDGIVVDDHARTSDPDIFAAGDVANHPNDLLGRRLRLESYENAQNQGITAGKAMLDKAESYAEIPWFWSDQFDVNLQMIGVPENWDETATRGDPAKNEFVTFYLKNGVIDGAISINNPRDLRFGKRLMQANKTVSVADLSNPDIKMQALLKG
ncbi:MAG: pyridine nucleotide-disulfide oxidoreductase [Rhodospirillaceae bacterium]|nr:pyridine nucleotide-disulfide oxidoreductase [Rhodospirillaceae bacterium]|tara:strand:+ start:4082 stop:5308 length:1227 start_codon:yes stop_codon:yes gene_type:complete